MIRSGRRLLAALLAAAIAFVAPGRVLAAEIGRVVVETPVLSGNGAAAAATNPAFSSSLGLAPSVGFAPSLRSFAAPSVDAPNPSATPSPWNPEKPTVLIAAPAATPAAVPAAAPVIGAASMPPLNAAPNPVKTVADPSDPLAPKPAGKKAYATTGFRKLEQAAAAIAERLQAEIRAQNGELPPPADAVDSLADASLAIDPNRAYHPSPDDWRDEVVYPIVVDRFAKGAGAKPFGDPADGTSRHGGNIRGVIEKLDYIKESGATTIIVSPLTMTIPEAYHGYAPVHFLAVDPHLGSMADFQELVAKAHAKGLRVVLDWVVNHAGPVFEYSDGKTQWTGDGERGPVEWVRTLKPVEFNEDDFSRKRVITDWNDHSQATQGDFPPNYRHFATDRPETQAKLIHIAQYWMKVADIDGFRLDAVRHVAPGFLPVFSAAIRDYAAKLGKKNFLMLGENSTGVDAELKPYIDDKSLDSLYNYPEFRRNNHALHGAAPTRDLDNSWRALQSALGDAASKMVRFVDLHDVYRFLLSDTPLELLKTGLAYALLSAGIPLVYAGTEQAFRQKSGRLEPEGGDLPADPDNRADMWAGAAYKPGVPDGPAFDRQAPGYKFMRALADLRAAYPALRRGAQYVRWSDQQGSGVYAFSRILDGQEVLVAINTSGHPRVHEMWVDAGISAPGTRLVDALNPDFALETRPGPDGAGSRVILQVPPYGVRVLVKATPQ